MDLLLVNQGICESKLYRTSGNFTKLNGRDIANLLYLNTLGLYMILQNSKQHDHAKEYAKQTTKYANYSSFKTHATDLYILCYIVAKPENNLTYKDHDDSVEFLNKLNFDDRRHYRFLKKLSTASDSRGEAVSFWLNLEKQLRIKDTNYKHFRRCISDWGNLRYKSKQQVLARLTQEIRKLAIGSELMKPLQDMLLYRKYKTADEYKVPRNNMNKRSIGKVQENEEYDKYRAISEITRYWMGKDDV